MNSEPDTSPPPVSPDPGKPARDWAMATHLSGLCCLLGAPSFVGPLICWLIKKDEMAEVDRAGKEALNFHITMAIVQLVSVPLVFVVVGIFTLIAAAVVSIVYSIIAGVEANKGVEYKYPMSYQFIK